MTSTTIYTPFTYCITFLPTRQRYYGSRYANNKKVVAHPDQLWITYFTSSKTISDLIKEHGVDSFTFEIRKTFKTRAETVSWESKFLTKIGAAQSSEWLNIHNGGTTFYADDETYHKIKSIKKRNGTEPNSLIVIQKQLDTKIKNGTMNNSSPESIQKSKDTKIRNGTTNSITPESIQKSKETRIRNGTEASNPLVKNKQRETKIKNGTVNSNTPDSIKKCKETKLKNGTLNPSVYQSVKDKKLLTCMIKHGVDNPSKVMFLSIIDTKKTYAKNLISRYYPDLKQYY